MTWTKLSDDFSDDCWTLSDAAVRLHVEGLIWSNRKLLDCRIAADDLPRISKAASAITELTDAGWWTHDDGIFTIRHHAMYQRTREQVVAQQERNQRNGSKGGRPTKPAREQTHETQSVSHRETQSVSEVGTQVGTHRDGTGLDGVCSVPATQVELTTAPEEEQHAHTHAREKSLSVVDELCAVPECRNPVRRACLTCADHMRREVEFRQAAS